MSDKVLQLDPTRVQATSNIRYGLKQYKLNRLMEDISNVGVETPVQVYLANDEEKVKGFDYVLWKGFYRHTSVAKLNAKGAGLTLPAMVVERPDEKTRALRQIAENHERENMSPVDTGRAISILTDLGVPKIDIRNAFAVAGGKKGMKVQPASNSYINMHLMFFKAPKALRDLIHDGKIGVGAANDLMTKHTEDKWQPIIDKILADREKAIDKDDAAEKKFLDTQKAVETKTQESEAKQAEVAKVAVSVEETAKTVTELSEKTSKLFQEKNAPGLTAEVRKAKETEFSKAESELNDARKANEKAAKEKAKAEEKAKKAADAAAAAAKKIADAAAAKKAAADTVIGQKDVAKAGKEVDPAAATAATKLNAGEIRDVIHNLTLPGTPDVIKDVFTHVEKCIMGITTPKTLFANLKKILGDDVSA